MEQLIGTTITIPVVELSGLPVRTELVTDVCDTPFTVAGIYESPFSYDTFVISDADFPDFFVSTRCNGSIMTPGYRYPNTISRLWLHSSKTTV